MPWLAMAAPCSNKEYSSHYIHRPDGSIQGPQAASRDEFPWNCASSAMFTLTCPRSRR